MRRAHRPQAPRSPAGRTSPPAGRAIGAAAPVATVPPALAGLALCPAPTCVDGKVTEYRLATGGLARCVSRCARCKGKGFVRVAPAR